MSRWRQRVPGRTIPVRQIYNKLDRSYLLKYLCYSVIKCIIKPVYVCDVQLEITLQYARLKAACSHNYVISCEVVAYQQCKGVNISIICLLFCFVAGCEEFQA